MTREQACVAGYDIVKNSGTAKTQLFCALEAAARNDYSLAHDLIESAEALICKAQSLKALFEKEVSRSNKNLQFVVEHGNDQLMTTIILKDLVCDITSNPANEGRIHTFFKYYH